MKTDDGTFFLKVTLIVLFIVIILALTVLLYRLYGN